jgi:hypothetical protein
MMKLRLHGLRATGGPTASTLAYSSGPTEIAGVRKLKCEHRCREDGKEIQSDRLRLEELAAEILGLRLYQPVNSGSIAEFCYSIQ